MRRGILKWLIGANKIVSTEKLVLIVLWLFQNDEGESCPSIAEIAAASSLSRATITRALGTLEEKGIIIKSPRYNKDGHKSNSYKIAPQPRSERIVYAHGDTMSGSLCDSHSLTERQSKKSKAEPRKVISNLDIDELAKEILAELNNGGLKFQD